MLADRSARGRIFRVKHNKPLIQGNSALLGKLAALFIAYLFKEDT